MTNNIVVKRDEIVDIVKGIGICCVVIGHSGSPITNFIYLFHMALFVIVSGYLFSEKTYNSFKNFLANIYRIFKRLWLPYFIFLSILILLHNYLIDINIITNNELFMNGTNGNHWGLTYYYNNYHISTSLFNALFFNAGEQIAGALWFLKTLFYVSLFSAIIRFSKNFYENNGINYQIIEFIIYYVFLISGYILYKINYNNYTCGTTLIALFIFYIGVLIKRYGKNYLLDLRLFIVSFFLLLLLNNNLKVDMGNNLYSSFILFIISSIAGYVFIYYISYQCSKLSELKYTLSYIGQNSLVILCFHFLAFKVVTLAQIYYYHLPIYRLASFPIYEARYWWVLYSLCGISLPLLISYIWHKIKTVLYNSIKFLILKFKTHKP